MYLQYLVIIDIYDVKREDQPGLKAFWKGGFVYGRDIKAALNNMKNYLPRTRVLRVENYKNIITVCPAEQKECLSKEDKNLLDQRIKERSEKKLNNELQKAFQNFIDSLNQCKDNKDKCGTLNFVNEYNIYYIQTTEQDNGIYLLKQVSEPDIQRDIIKIENEELKLLQITLYKPENEELDRGYIFKNNEVVITSEDGEIIITQ